MITKQFLFTSCLAIITAVLIPLAKHKHKEAKENLLTMFRHYDRATYTDTRPFDDVLNEIKKRLKLNLPNEENEKYRKYLSSYQRSLSIYILNIVFAIVMVLILLFIFVLQYFKP